MFIKQARSAMTTYIVTTPQGQHCIFANLGDSVNTLKPDILPQNILDGIDCFYTDLFSSRAALKLAGEARRREIPVVFNMQCVPQLMMACGISKNEIEEMFSLCTLFIAGKEVYRELTGAQEPRLALTMLAEQFAVKDGLIYTAGSDGAYWKREERILKQKAFASAAAALKCTVKGPRSVADLATIEDFIHSQQND